MRLVVDLTSVLVDFGEYSLERAVKRACKVEIKE